MNHGGRRVTCRRAAGRRALYPESGVVSFSGAFLNGFGDCAMLHGSLTDLYEEVVMICLLLAAIVGPHLLTYFTSGLFGCASRRGTSAE
jgi:hypothetical protein